MADTYEKRREERRAYENDVFYEVWRRGGNPDRIDYDRVEDSFYDGTSAGSHASLVIDEQWRCSECGTNPCHCDRLYGDLGAEF